MSMGYMEESIYGLIRAGVFFFLWINTSESRNNLTTFDETLPCQICKILSEILGDDRRLRTDGQTNI